MSRYRIRLKFEDGHTRIRISRAACNELIRRYGLTGMQAEFALKGSEGASATDPKTGKPCTIRIRPVQNRKKVEKL